MVAIGAPISTKEHIEASDYTPLVTSIISRLDPYSIEKMEALLLAIEARIEKCNAKEVQVLNPTTRAHVAQPQSWNSKAPNPNLGFRYRGFTN